MMNNFDVEKFDVAQYDDILARGLSKGLGSRDSNMCIEAAICTVLGLEHGNDPKCVADAVRFFKITLNDAEWSSSQARAAGLRKLGLAQLGSLGVVDNKEFAIRMARETIKVLIPKLFRQIFPGDAACLIAARRCEIEGTAGAAEAAEAAADDEYLLLSASIALQILRDLGSPGVRLLAARGGELLSRHT